MAADLILKVSTIITMNRSSARAEAVAIDTAAGTIVAVGDLQECRSAAPSATVRDLGATVLMPGFIDPHSQAMVTRQTASGRVHAANQAVTLDEAIRAHTINAAFQIGRDHDLGSIEAGKCADFVELSADPFTADVHRLTDAVQVQGTSARTADNARGTDGVKRPALHQPVSAA